ncbi:MAG: hypothetical protein US68_C0016G0008 [Candidatus Shapirobacteria bacterium GW2011_GWE1_38_10]|uniref:O-antigen ligase-related domain-containing protein n=1 Tax=Candidatus Shapirobacteria bacterium GW2011_GWE1_38_10 TaxID=1618488 RepID=A0A0G0I1Z8_9BACT|nr:MAG: hypothetical protein US46_C0009G0010 [Candidatus Shapirobacteria bacterium GW2011_GWF2_37_20]KKQ49348.1 MAG: hypothetical protein US68_C0016G0008 [Candidatus Shapirobacteria bacterium GW2011_GWE1_38_10]KKQ65083.1 MAG: hypothetical protein US85_C0001G0010 [Candidatus Shapirobacteria bacterium GW2011_GWF1_38_23]
MGCLFLPNTKFYFLASILLVLIIFGVSRSWEKVVIYGYWLLSIYYVGQLYVFQVIRTEELYHPLYPNGRSLYFKFTPLLVLGMTMIISWTIKLIKEKCRSNWLIVILLMSVLTKLISSFMGNEILPWWVEMGKIINDLSLVIWLWWVTDYLGRVKTEEKKYFWDYMGKILKISIIVGSIIVILQVLKGSVLGLVVEQRTDLPFDGNAWLPRVVGIWNHPNEAAFNIFTWTIAWALIEIRQRKKLGEVLNRWLLIPLTALLCLQSRSIFLGMGLITLWGIYFYRKEISWSKILEKRIKGVKSWLMVVTVSLILLFIGNSFVVSITNLGENSGWDTRQKLINVAKDLADKHLWWGVGEGNFIPVAFREDKSGTMKAFPESVHQGWVLILTEKGVVGLSVWLIFILTIVLAWWKKSKNNMELRWLFYVTLLTQFVVMMFQPFSNILMVNLVAAMLLLASEEKSFF